MNADKSIKPHAVLTKDLAIEIYRYRIENMEVVSFAVGRHASMLAARFGVSEKTIRDIWTARTWSEETRILDPIRIKRANDSARSLPVFRQVRLSDSPCTAGITR